MNEYSKVNWQDGTVLQPAKVTIDGVDHEVTPAVESGTTPVNATNLDKMDTALKQAHDGVRSLDANKIDKSTIELLTVDSTAPENCNEGDLYYNTTTNLIYTATATDTWSETGELPTSKYLYVDLSNSKLYYYDGNNFTSYGGGNSNDVVISPDQPTGDDWKLWIDKDEVINSGSEVVDSLDGNETNKAPSVRVVNNKINDIDTKLHDYIIVRNVDIQCRDYTSVIASVPSGYKFLCWLQPASYGSIKAAYMEVYNNQTTNIWVVNADSDLRHSFHCPYLCIRDI